MMKTLRVLVILMLVPTVAAGAEVDVVIEYPGQWVGFIEDDDGHRPINGEGNTTLHAKGGNVYAQVTKGDDPYIITIKLMKGSRIFGKHSTTESNGTVDVEYDFGGDSDNATFTTPFVVTASLSAAIIIFRLRNFHH